MSGYFLQRGAAAPTVIDRSTAMDASAGLRSRDRSWGVGGRRSSGLVIGLLVVLMATALAASARAAFPGRNGLLAVQPVNGNGIVLVGTSGRGGRRICTKVSVCGHPRRPEFSPDGRSILFAGPAVRLVGTDGSCQNCRFGPATAPAFRGDGTLVTFASGATLFEDGIDGIRQMEVVGPGSVGFQAISDAVWSVRGAIAVAAGDRIWIGKPDRLRSAGRGSSPSWSPDGSRVAFVRDGWIIVLRVSGGAARRLVRGSAAAFSPDGRSIAFVDGRHRVEVISSSGGRAWPVGRVRGLAVDWQPSPSGPAACVSPPGAKVLARSSKAVVTAETGPNRRGDRSLPATAVMGCLTADGRERLLESSTFNSIDGATDYPIGALGGAYAGVVVEDYDEHYGGESKTVEVFDLRTGARPGFGGERSSCDPFQPCVGIDQLVVGQDGVSAVHVDQAEVEDWIWVACASASFCVAHNGFGDVLSSTDPANGPWSSAKVAILLGMSCPSTSLCVGVNNNPAIYVSGNPTGGSSTWIETQIPGVDTIPSVSCPSPTLCVAAAGRFARGTDAGGGDVLVSADPTGGPSAWSVDAVDRATLQGVSCPSTSECFAVDDAGNVISSQNPTGGTTAWTVQPHLLSHPVRALSCPSSSLCVAGGYGSGLLVSTDPAASPWTTTNSSFVARDVSCPSTSLCVAVGQSGVSVSTDPSSGEWTSYPLIATPQSISCPTTSFCAIGTVGVGYAFTSSNPAAGSGAWRPVLADTIDCTTTPSACGTEQITASDRTGVHTLDSSTEFEAKTGPQLTGVGLTGDTLSWNDHGSPTSVELKP